MRQVLVLLVLLSLGPVALATPPDPDKIVRGTVAELAALVRDCRLPLAGDPIALRGVIDQELRPHADVLYAGQLILGRHWGDASPEDRRRFIEALYGTLLSRYAAGLLLLTDRNVRVVPGATEARRGEMQVEMRVQAGPNLVVPVYLQLRWSNERWKIYDARWEGQSYVLSLRQAFAEQIRRDGLETVIQRLEATAGTPAGSPLERETAAGRCLRARAAR